MFSLSIYSQEFIIPENVHLGKAEDYAPLEKDVVKAVEWLLKTPINEQKQKRVEIHAFLIKWLSGSPYVHLEIKPEIVTFVGSKTPDLLMIFMGGWAKYLSKPKIIQTRPEAV